MAKSVKERIDELVNKLGELPPPSTDFMKGKLVKIGTLVEALENGADIRDAETKIAALETELGNLKLLFQTENAELETFRAERKKQEEEKRREEIPEIQFQILNRIPSERAGMGAWVGIAEILQTVNIPVDEADFHLEQLKKNGLATEQFNSYESRVWYRTASGNTLVLAKRLAGEAEEPKKTYKHADLPEVEQLILTLLKGFTHAAKAFHIAAGLNLQGIEASEAKTEYLLRGLEKKGFVTSDDETYGTGTDWFMTEDGSEYLGERDLL